MTTTSRPNRDALTQAIDIYRDAMRPFVLRCLRRVRGSGIEDTIRQSLSLHQADDFARNLQRNNDLASAIDVNHFGLLINKNWNEAFSNEFGDDRTISNTVWVITSARNQVSHVGTRDLDTAYAMARLYDIADVLGRINAPSEKRAVEEISSRLLAPPAPVPVALPEAESGARPTEPPPGAQRPAGQTQRAAGLRPWREVIPPNQDVAQGSHQQAEFAADLQQVYDGRAISTQYGNPVNFFSHTYITPGIRTLLVNTLKRLAGRGGDPVIQTKTGFGGGKTHSLIALYHLVRNAGMLVNSRDGDDADTGAEIRAIMDEAGYDQERDELGEIAVLDGTFLATTDAKVTRESGDPLNTLWGEMAYQLGGQEAYNIIGEAARQGSAPGGGQLDELFDYVGPCVILIDEAVAYVRNAGAARDSIYTFIQALTQSVRRSSEVALVITLPQSRVEAGGEAGEEALARLEGLLGRIEAVWEPLAVSETFEVVRRRLFGAVTDADARERTCEAFARMYSNNRREYPQGVAESNYLERMRACYPVHPEIFDRLYSDWSSIQGFQRTRGVLRMMANCVNRLYLNEDPSPLIMPADLPLSDATLANEFIRLLSEQWRPAMSEVDSYNSRTDNIDRESLRFGEVGGAARRIARCVFLGSAGSGAIKGIDARQIHLGVVRPGQGVSAYNEALNRMAGNLYYLYSAGDRYFFHAEENLNKVANDRADALTDREVDAHVRVKLEEARNRRTDVINYTGDTAGVPDDDSVRLAALPPNLSLPSRAQEEDSATPEALRILRERGDAPRVRRNTLLFLTARRDEIRGLRSEVRKYLAWHSIVNGASRIQTLSGERLRQARDAIGAADSAVTGALVRAYRWALAPVQPDPQNAEYYLNETQTNATDSGEIFLSAFDKFIENEALVEVISPAALTIMLERYIWNTDGGGGDVQIAALWDQMTGNVYMHRLRKQQTLMQCVEQGVAQGDFGYAAAYDGETYDGLHFEQTLDRSGGVVGGERGLLVRREVAAGQKQAEEREAPKIETPTNPCTVDPTPDGTDPHRNPDPPGTTGSHRARRIVVRKSADANLSLDDFTKLHEEIIRNLNDDSGEVSVEITITARKSDGFSEGVTRSVRENSDQLCLKFTTSDDE